MSRTRKKTVGAKRQVGSELTAISLFSSGGIGDLALRAAGARLLVASELLESRADILAANFPEAHVIQGDIAENLARIESEARKRLDGRVLDILFATPPCQGMSKNGRGKLLQGIRAGMRPKLDPRNGLIFHAVELARRLKPRLIVFENVPEMLDTVVEVDGEYPTMLDAVSHRLAPEYIGRWRTIEFADLGVPQRRQRLISVFVGDAQLKRRVERGEDLFPTLTHSKVPTLYTKNWVSVFEALKGLPSLDAKCEETARSHIPYHYVSVLDEKKYFWVSNTPPGRGAFDNQCVNPRCGFQGNPTHGAQHDEEGINRARDSTPLYCVNCGSLLPRPWVEDKKTGKLRIMSGFTSAYKRMAGDLPASALTTNLSYACSDQKLHPTENRVLSIHEACIIHTISDYQFSWTRASGARVGEQTIRDIIGESIPPRGLEIIFRRLIALLTEDAGQSRRSVAEAA